SLFNAMADTRSASRTRFVRAPDFLQGALKSLRSETEFMLTLPEPGGSGSSEPLFLYLPTGEYAVTMEGPLRAWKPSSETKTARSQGSGRLTLTQTDWHKLIVTRGPEGNTPARLKLRKR